MRLGRFARVYVLIAAAVSLAACSSGPFPAAPSVPGALTTGDSSGASVTLTIFAKNSCKHPQFGLVCVEQGGSSKLSLVVTCRIKTTGKLVSCGTVTWTTKTSNTGLKGTFDPKVNHAPKHTTLETVAASGSIKPGKYKQTITASTSRAGPKTESYPITVEKK
jgi:hypothetical protein